MRKLEQKEYPYTFSAKNPPVMRVKPGETIVTSIPDCWSGEVKNEKSRLPLPQSQALFNPCCGPIYVEGAAKGDQLVVRFLDIKLDSDEGNGVTGLPLDDLTYTLTKPYDYTVIMCKIKDGKVMFKNGIEVPATPSVGVVGVAPLYGAIPSGDAGRHGGNLDVPEIRKGSTVYLPVFHEGGLLGLADAHAMDPNGELTAMDIPATITFSVDLIKGKEINWPRIDNEEYIMSVNTNSPIVPSAVNCGISELILWLGEHGIDMWKAWEKIALVAEFPISRFNPPVLNAKFPKKYIKT